MSTKKPVFIAATKADGDFDVLPLANLMKYAAVKADEKPTRMAADIDTAEFAYQGLVQPLYDLESLMALPEINTWHNRCARVKANDVAGLGFELVPVGDDADEFKTDSADEAACKAFFTSDNQPRPIDHILTDCQTDSEFVAQLGLEIVRDGYDPEAYPVLMAHIPAQYIYVHKDENKYAQKIGARTVWFKRFGYKKDVNKKDGSEHELGTLDKDDRASEILFDADFSGRSDYYGMAQILPALGAIEGMQALRNYNLDFFRFHGVPAWAIYITGDYDLGPLVRVLLEADGSGTLGEEYDPSDPDMSIDRFQYQIISEVKRHLANIARNPHTPLVMAVPSTTPESKVMIEFVPLATDVKDSSFQVYRKDNRDEIICAHGVPSYRIGIVETGALGGSTAVESTRIYRDSVINPRKRRLEALINKHIIRDGFGVKTLEFRFNDLDLAEEDHEKDIAGFMFDRGAMRPVDILNYFGSTFGLTAPDESEQPGLYKYYINSQPLDQAGNLEQSFAEAVKGMQEQLLRLIIEDKNRQIEGGFNTGGVVDFPFPKAEDKK